MDIFVVIQQMLVLLAMMAVGYVVYKIDWLDEHSYVKLSKIVVNILNPAIIINGVLGKDSHLDGTTVKQTVILMVIYFIILVVISRPVASLLRVKGENRNIYQLMMIFSNVGFMGIPVISSIYGTESIVLIAFYTLGYNVLLYTYGLYLARGAASDQTEAKDEKRSLLANLGKLLISPGIIACIVAIIIFATGIQLPDSVGTFFNYTGNSVVPFSMFLIGASVAKGGKKEFFTDIRFYIFAAIKMLVIPIVAALIMRMLPWEPIVKGVFILMLSMPVGSIVIMIAKECGADEMECTKGSIVSTLLSVITIPIVAYFLPF